jgi:non-homologous end joining protein Ku
MAPRANWRGFLRLSLVTCPIALFPATSESEKVSFNQNRMIHPASSGSRFRCGVLGVVKAGGRVVASDNVAATVPQRPWSLLPAL